MKEELEKLYKVLKDLEQGSAEGQNDMQSDFGKGLRSGEELAYGHSAKMLLRILADL